MLFVSLLQPKTLPTNVALKLQPANVFTKMFFQRSLYVLLAMGASIVLSCFATVTLLVCFQVCKTLEFPLTWCITIVMSPLDWVNESLMAP